MKRFTKILFLLLVSFYAKSQAPAPSGFPSPYSTGYYRIGWLQSDSGSIPAYRDTMWIPRFQGTEILWLHAGVDTAKWIRIGNKWVKELKSGDVPNLTATLPIVYNAGNISCPTCGTGGGGIVSLNGLTPTTQTLATGSSGSDFNISSSGSVHTFNIPDGGPSARGLLTTSLYNIFIGKQDPLNGTGFVKVTGTTVSYDNTAYYPNSNPSSFISRTGISALAPILYNSSTGVMSADTTAGNTHLATQAYVLSHQASGTLTGAGNLVPLFTTSVASNTLIFTLSNSAANSILGNNNGSTAAPAYFVPTSTTLNGWFGGNIQPQISGTGFVKASGTTISYDNSTYLVSVSVVNLANLRTLSTVGLADSTLIAEAGYATSGDGGGGIWMWSISSSATDNGITVVNPTGHAGAGRWVRQFTGGLNIRWNGVFGDGTTNCTAAFQAVIDLAAASTSGTRTVNVPQGVTGAYEVDSLIVRPIYLTGDNDRVTIHARTGSASGVFVLPTGVVNEGIIQNFTIQGNLSNPGQHIFNFTAKQAGSPFNGGLWNFLVQNIHMFNVSGHAIHLYASDVSGDLANQYLAFNNVESHGTADSTYRGVYAEGQLAQTKFTNMQIYGVGSNNLGTVGIELKSLATSNDQMFGALSFDNVLVQAIRKVMYTYNVQGFSFSNGWLENDSIGFHLDAQSRGSFFNNRIANVAPSPGSYIFGNDNSLIYTKNNNIGGSVGGRIYTSPSGTSGGTFPDGDYGQTTLTISSVFQGQNINVASNALNTLYFQDIVTNGTYSTANYIVNIVSSLVPGKFITIRENDNGNPNSFVCFKNGGNVGIPLNGVDTGYLVLRGNASAIFMRSDLLSNWALVGLSQPHIYMAAYPTTGTWFKGERVRNNNPVSGQAAEWVCKTTGSPGVWDSVTLGATGGGSGITALTGDVVATGPGSVSSLIQANAITTTKILNNAVTLGKMATGPANYLVGYDGSGNAAALAPDTLFLKKIGATADDSLMYLNNDTIYNYSIRDSANFHHYRNQNGGFTFYSTGGGGSGTVTSFSAGNLSPLFTTSVATSTTTPALTFSLSNAAANTAFGNFTGSSATPAFGKVPLAAMATGTSNSLIGYDGSGNPSVVTAGTNVTISGGSISATGGGGLTPIAANTVLGVSNITGSTATPTAQFISYYVATNYPGIVGDSSTDCTVGLQNLINFVPSGSTIWLPPGKYITSSVININKAITITGGEGAIGNDNSVNYQFTTAIHHSNNSDTAFRINSSGVQLNGFLLILSNGTTATSTSRGIYWHNAKNCGMMFTQTQKFYINHDIKQGGEWRFIRCYFRDAVKSSIDIRDTSNIDDGDQHIAECTFSNGTTAGIGSNFIRYYSGGGLDIFHNKFSSGSAFNAGDCILVPFVGTVDFFVRNNSFENFTGAAVKIVPTGSLANVIITGNEFGYHNLSATTPYVYIDGSGGSGTSYGYLIANNVYDGNNLTDTAIYINGVIHVSAPVTGSTFRQMPNKIILGGTMAFNTNLDVVCPTGVQGVTHTSLVNTTDGQGPNETQFALTGNDTIKIKDAIYGRHMIFQISQPAGGGLVPVLPSSWTNVLQGNINKLNINLAPFSATYVEGFVNTGKGLTITSVNRNYTNGSIGVWGGAWNEYNTGLFFDSTNKSLILGSANTANSRAALIINSTTQGILLPRMTTTQVNAIASPPEGLFLYDLTIHATKYYNGTAYVSPLQDPTTTLNDIIYNSGSGLARLAGGANNTFLAINGSGTIGWIAAGGTISGLTTNTIPKALTASTIGDSHITDNGNTIKILAGPALEYASYFNQATGINRFRGAVNQFNDSSGYSMFGSGSQLNSALVNVAGILSVTGAGWFNSTSSSTGLRILISGNDEYIDNISASGSTNFRTNGLSSSPLSLRSNGNITMGSLTDNSNGLVQIIGTSQAQLTIQNTSTLYGSIQVNSAGSWGWRHMTGFTLPSAALAQGTGSDSVLAIRTSASGIDTLVKILQPSGSGGVTTVGTFDSQTPAANGSVISGTSIFEQSASGTVPGLVNISTQTFAGAKTFSTSVATTNFVGTGSMTINTGGLAGSVSGSGTNVSGKITWTAPTVTGAGGSIFILNPSVNFTTANPNITLTPANANAATLAALTYVSATTNSSVTISLAVTTITAGTVYTWYYSISN